METCTKKMTTWCHLAVVLLTLACIIFLTVLSIFFYKKSLIIGKPDNVRDTFSMSGTGEVMALPDIALLSAGLETTLVKVEDAQKENTEKMNGFLVKVKLLGVEEKDRKTTSYTIYPKYEYRREGDIDKNSIVGYTVNNQVQLKIRNLDKLADIIELFGQFGLNQVGSLAFNVDDDKELRQQALEKAIENARAKAERLAHSAHIRIGRMVSFSEQGNPPYSPAYDYAQLKTSEAGRGENMGMNAPTVERGSQKIVADVQVVYEILP